MSYLLTIELIDCPEGRLERGIHFALVNKLNLNQINEIIRHVDEFKKVLLARKDDLINKDLPADLLKREGMKIQICKHHIPIGMVCSKCPQGFAIS